MMHLLIALKRRGFKFPKYVLWQIIGWAKKVFDFTPEVARFLRPKMSPTYIAVGGIFAGNSCVALSTELSPEIISKYAGQIFAKNISQLIERIYAENLYGNFHQRCMKFAIKQGRRKIVLDLLEKLDIVRYSHALSDTFGTDLFPPLFASTKVLKAFSCERGSLELVRLILRCASTDPNQCFTAACHGGKFDNIMECIRNGANAWQDGLNAAGNAGHFHLVRWLHSFGATDLTSPFNAACVRGNLQQLIILRELEQKNVNRYNETGLFLAAIHGHEEVFEYLLRTGGAITNRVVRGAFESGNEKIIRLAVESGIDLIYATQYLKALPCKKKVSRILAEYFPL